MPTETSQPWPASAWTTAAPMPRLPPETRATRRALTSGLPRLPLGARHGLWQGRHVRLVQLHHEPQQLGLLALRKHPEEARRLTERDRPHAPEQTLALRREVELVRAPLVRVDLVLDESIDLHLLDQARHGGAVLVNEMGDHRGPDPGIGGSQQQHRYFAGAARQRYIRDLVVVGLVQGKADGAGMEAREAAENIQGDIRIVDRVRFQAHRRAPMAPHPIFPGHGRWQHPPDHFSPRRRAWTGPASIGWRVDALAARNPLVLPAR